MLGTRRIGRRRFIAGTVAALGAAGLAGSASVSGPTRRSKPNILLICSDQQHWQAMGAVDPRFETPHLDALLSRSTRFAHAYCTTPQCSPSRSTLYTGLYPHRTGVIGNVGSVGHHGRPVPGLPAHMETLGSRLRVAGYHTGYTGKWHLDAHETFRAHFDEARLDGDAHGGATDHAAEYLAERAKDPERPFALMVNYINPHDVYEFTEAERDVSAEPVAAKSPPPRSFADTLEDKPVVQKEFMTQDQGRVLDGHEAAWWERYRELYREKCRLLDVEVGRLLGSLEASGSSDRTIVVFASDHGDMDTQHRLIYKGPFMYDHLVRVPLVMYVPETLAGSGAGVCERFALLADVVPTLCVFAGADAGETDGASWQGFLTGAGPGPQRDYVVSQYYNKQSWVNPIRMIRTKTMKYNRYVDHGEEMYDLAEDPHELRNLARDAGYASERDDLRAELDRWMAQHDDLAFDSYWSTTRAGARRFPPESREG